MNDIKIKLFAIAKDEATYIPHWVFHHFYFGFDEIEIWLNNTTDNSIQVCQRLSEVYDRFKFKVVDDFFEKCVQNGENFQVQAYNHVVFSEYQSDYFTHIMFLDLDEFFTSRDFQKNIKNILEDFSNADSISFSWYMDNGDYSRLLFDRIFQHKQEIIKDIHVKSLVKLSKNLISAGIHNHCFGATNTQILYNGEKIEVNSSNNYGSKLSKEQFVASQLQIDEFFILHKVFKSQIEYIASLYRGRSHVGWDNVLKNNRWGYTIYNSVLNFTIQEEKLGCYNEQLAILLSDSILCNEIIKAYQYLLDRYKNVENLVKTSVEKYSQSSLFKGVNLASFEDIAPPDIRFNIESIKFENNNLLTISGWALWYSKGEKIHIRFFDKKNKLELVGRMQYLKRPDVIRAVDKRAPIESGFVFSTTIDYDKYSGNPKIEFLEFNKDGREVLFNIGNVE